MASIDQASAKATYNEKPENWNNNIPANEPGKKNNAKLLDPRALLAAGINPVTGLPMKMGAAGEGFRKESIKKNLRIIDEQDAVNRYRWYNLPCNLTSQEVERFMYYKGQLAFFYLEASGEFFFMPYALDGGLDFYGRFNGVHPIPFAEGTSDDEKREIAKQRSYLSTLKLKCIYDVVQPEEITPELITGSCVLLKDYTPQLSQTIIPRQQLQEGLLDIMSDCIPFMRTALLNATGVMGMRVQGEDEQSNVNAASALIDRAALNGEKYIALVGQIDFQELTGGEVAKAEEFLLAMQALDNFRLSTYGIDNGGLFEKKAHTLQSEQDMNTGSTGFVYNDGLSIRQHFCDVVNSIWGLGIWCDASECALGADMNGDGLAYDTQDQSGMAKGQQPVQMEAAQ